MDYEIVYLEDKIVVGLMASTSNTAPDMGEVIGGVWQQFYQTGFYNTLLNKKNDKALGIYTDYSGDEKGDYNILVASEVNKAEEVPDGAIVKTLSGGKFAKFVVKGHMHKVVNEFWQELWKMDLSRSFNYDFEEYQDCNIDDAEIHIYIGLK